MSRKVSRRAIVGMLGGGAIAVPAVIACPVAEVGDLGPLLAPFTIGSVIGRWTLVDVGPVRHGAARVAMRGERGEPFVLEILARDPRPLAPRPPAETERFAIHVDNGGDGYKQTDEEAGLAAMALAEAIAKNEARVDVTAFLSHAARIERFRTAMIT